MGIGTTVVVSVLLTFALLHPATADEGPGTPGRVSLTEGEVLVQVQGTPDWAPAPSNTPLGPGDRLWVAGQGRAEVELPAGSVVRLGDETRVQVRALSQPAAPLTRLRLERGTLMVYAQDRTAGNDALTVDVAQASLQAALPSVFRVDLFADSGVQIAVQSGEVTAQTPTGDIPIGSRQTARLVSGQAPQFYALAPPDDFDRWNALRDQQVARTAIGPTPLPAPLAPYSSDLAAYGRWVSIPEYGECWAPFVEAGWVPFRFGGWSWWRGDYVWVSDEPWGWLPYHYGRWLFYPAVGWVWVLPPAPTPVVWSPGAVGWLTGPDFVGWVPLAPGEVFVAHRFHGPRTVNVTNVNATNVFVTNVQVNQVFVNARAPNATVFVRRNAFLAGRRVTASLIPAREALSVPARVSFAPPPAPVPARTMSTPAAIRSITTPPRWPTPPSRSTAERDPRSWPAGPTGPPARSDSPPARVMPAVKTPPVPEPPRPALVSPADSTGQRAWSPPAGPPSHFAAPSAGRETPPLAAVPEPVRVPRTPAPRVATPAPMGRPSPEVWSSGAREVRPGPPPSPRSYPGATSGSAVSSPRPVVAGSGPVVGPRPVAGSGGSTTPGIGRGPVSGQHGGASASVPVIALPRSP